MHTVEDVDNLSIQLQGEATCYDAMNVETLIIEFAAGEPGGDKHLLQIPWCCSWRKWRKKGGTGAVVPGSKMEVGIGLHSCAG